jgi:hypothetical protein
MKTFEERFSEFYDNLYESQQFDLIRRYRDANNYELVYDMDEFDEVFQNFSPYEIARQASCDFNPDHKYFYFNGQGNLESSNNLLEWTDFDAMAKWYEWHDHIPEQIDADEWDATAEDEDEQDDEE